MRVSCAIFSLRCKLSINLCLCVWKRIKSGRMMEPTTEISRGLEALRIAGQAEGSGLEALRLTGQVEG